MWYRTQKDRRVETMQRVPETSLHDVWQVELSPGDEYLAVLSEGEGHPMVDVFAMRDLWAPVDADEDGDDRPVAPVRTVNPYPGTVWIKGWQGDTCLVVESNVPLDLLDKEARTVPAREPDLEAREFLWDISADTVRRK